MQSTTGFKWGSKLCCLRDHKGLCLEEVDFGQGRMEEESCLGREYVTETVRNAGYDLRVAELDDSVKYMSGVSWYNLR